MKKQAMIENEITQYAADMNVLLAYYHMKDDWADEKKVSGLLGADCSRKRQKRLRSNIQGRVKQSGVFAGTLRLKRERSGDRPISRLLWKTDKRSVVYKEDMWEETLRRMGFFLGKYIYIMDAYEDLEEDLRKQFNPLKSLHERADYEEQIRQILCMMIAECSAEFENLPCLLDGHLRNILTMMESGIVIIKFRRKS